MRETILFSIIESPSHPKLSGLYQRLGIKEVKLTSMRKAISELKRQPPDIVVADFLYGYGNNYAGVNVSNLDVFLYSLQKYSENTRIIVLTDKSERKYVNKLEQLFPLHGILQYPVREPQLEALLIAKQPGSDSVTSD
jgi:DNA-binding NarL/FixJ family response regulator